MLVIRFVVKKKVRLLCGRMSKAYLFNLCINQYEEEDERGEESQWEYDQILIASILKYMLYKLMTVSEP